MRANIRSLSGAVLMLVIIPILAGLLACMPVPIGNPEQSRIDPALSGWWVLEEADSDAGLCLLRPYDTRTWLVVMVSVEAGDAVGTEEPDITTAGDMFAVLRHSEIGPQGIVGGEPAVYKTWITRIGGERFMTWESIADIADFETFAPEAWFVFRVRAQSDNDFELAMVDAEYDAFEDLVDELEEEDSDPWRVRKRWERAISKHLDDPELYDDSPMRLRRIPNELVPKAARLVTWSFDN